MKYEAEHYPNRTARTQFVFLLIFSPALLVGIFFLPIDLPKVLLFVCVVPALALAGFLTFRLSRQNQPQRWRIDDDFAEYSTPTPLLGGSFRTRITEIEKIILDGDSDFARCLTTSGNEYRFDIRTREGRRFLELLREIAVNRVAGSVNSPGPHTTGHTGPYHGGSEESVTGD